MQSPDVLIGSALIDLVLAAILATYRPPVVVLALQDDGYGKCPAFQHSHEGDLRCFDNDDNPQVEHGPVLPVPHYQT